MYRRKRTQKASRFHYLLLLNTGSAKYSPNDLAPLTAAIKQKGGFYTICEGKSVAEMLGQAKTIIGADGKKEPDDSEVGKRGKITDLIACGGDGTVNAVAKLGLDMGIPMGILPIGRYNNVAMGLYGKLKESEMIERLLNRTYRPVDVATAAGQVFTGVVGIGIMSELAKLLNDRRLPRFSFGWSSLGNKAVAALQPRELTVTVDAFRFNISPLLLTVHLLPQTFGLRLSPASVNNDGKFEAIMHFTGGGKEVVQFLKQVYKGNYVFNGDIRQFRGRTIVITGTKGMELYVDGDVIPLMTNTVEIKMLDKQLQVLG